MPQQATAREQLEPLKNTEVAMLWLLNHF